MRSDQSYVTKLLSERKYSQPYIIKIMQALGYKTNPKGVCHGFSVMAIQAFLSNDMKTFRERIDYMVSENTDILTLCQTLQKKLSSKIPHSQLYFTAEEKKVIALKNFLEGVELYHSPDNYVEFLGEKFHHKLVVETSKKITSIAVEDNGGMVAFKGWLGVYDQNQLKNYVFILDLIAQKHKQNLIFEISGHYHAVTLAYHTGTWSIYDADNLLYGEFKLKELATKLFEIFVHQQAFHDALTPELLAKSGVVLHTQLFTTGNDKENCEKYLASLQTNNLFIKLHQITAQSAAFTGGDLETLATSAGYLKYFDVLDQIVAVGGDIDKLNLRGWSGREFRTSHEAGPVKAFTMEELEKTPNERRIFMFTLDLGRHVQLQLYKRNNKIRDVYHAMTDSEEKNAFLELTDTGYFNSNFFDAEDLTILNYIATEKHEKFFTVFGNDRLLGLIKTAEDILLILKLLTPAAKDIFIASIVSNAKILKLFTTTFQLMKLSKLLSDDQRQVFFSTISDAILLGLTNSTHDFLMILRITPESKKLNYFKKAENKLDKFFAYNENNSTYIKGISKFKKEFKKIAEKDMNSYLDKIIDGETQKLVEQHKNIEKVLQANSQFLIMYYHFLQGRYTHLLTKSSDLSNIFSVVDMPDTIYLLDNIDRELLCRLFNSALDILRMVRLESAYVTICLKKLGDAFLVEVIKKDLSLLPHILIILPENKFKVIIDDLTDEELCSAVKEAQDYAIIYYVANSVGRQNTFFAKFGLDNLLHLIVEAKDLEIIFLNLEKDKQVLVLKQFTAEKIVTLIKSDSPATIRKNVASTLSNELLIQLSQCTSMILTYLEYLPSQRIGGFLDDVLNAIRNGKLKDDKEILPVLLQRETERMNVKVNTENEMIKQFILFINYAQCQFVGAVNAVNLNSLFSCEPKMNIRRLTAVMKSLEETDDLSCAVNMMIAFLNDLLIDTNADDAFIRQLVGLFESVGLLTEDEWKNFKSFLPDVVPAVSADSDLKTSVEIIVSTLEKLPKLFGAQQPSFISI